MDRVFRLAVFAICFIVLSAASHTYAANNRITDLVYSKQNDNNLLIAGKYKGRPVNIVRKGKLGEGTWAIYTGTLTDRVRLTIDDSKGLQEILAMDQGQRIMLNIVGQERVEYRFYLPGHKFIIGSVLYRKNKRWLQGIMKTEAFPGYPALTRVKDVTKSIAAQSARPKMKLTDWLIDRWHNINLISTAHAEDAMEGDNWLKNEFGNLAQGAWPSTEIFKGALCGATAFAVRLAKESIGTGEVSAVRGAAVLDVASVEAAIVIGAPLVAAIGAGVVIGLVAERGYNWLVAKNLTGDTSVSDYYAKMTASTSYSEESPPEVPSPLETTSRKQSSPDKNSRNLRPSEKLKALVAMAAKLDKEEFDRELEVIDSCTANRDYACAEDHVAKASRLASSYTDNELLSAARRRISKQKKEVAVVAKPVQNKEPHAVAKRSSTDETVSTLDNDKLVYGSDNSSKPQTTKISLDCGTPGQIFDWAKYKTPEVCWKNRQESYYNGLLVGRKDMSVEECCAAALNNAKYNTSACYYASYLDGVRSTQCAVYYDLVP